jgi:hypothetical protein
MPTDHQVTGDGVWFESKDRAKMYADAYGKDLVEAKAVGWRRTLSRWDPAYDLYEGLLRSARSGIEWQRREKEAMDADDEEERRREFAFSCGLHLDKADVDGPCEEPRCVFVSRRRRLNLLESEIAPLDDPRIANRDGAQLRQVINDHLRRDIRKRDVGDVVWRHADNRGDPRQHRQHGERGRRSVFPDADPGLVINTNHARPRGEL